MALTLSPNNVIKNNDAITSLPIIIDGPGKYRTRSGLEVRIDKVVEGEHYGAKGALCFVDKGTGWKKHWQKDRWTTTGLYLVNPNHLHDVVSKVIK